MRNSNILQFSPFVTRKRLVFLVSFLGFVNILLLVGTGWSFFADQIQLDGLVPSRLNLFLSSTLLQLSLSEENVFSSWYSSMLMLAVSFVSLICYLADVCLEYQPEYRRLSYGWLALALMFVILSADELGSFHERIGMLPGIPTDKALGWVPLFEFPIGIVAGLLIIFGWLKMSRYWLAAILVVIGTGLYVINPTLEELQRLLLQAGILNPSQLQLYNLSILIEEGGELFGSLAYLVSVLLYCGARLNTFSASSVSYCQGVRIKISTPVILNILYTFAGIFAFLMLGIQRADIRSWMGDTGIPDNWFPSAMAFLSTMVCLLIIDSTKKKRGLQSCLYLIYAAFCMALSLYYGLNFREYLTGPGSSDYFTLEWTHQMLTAVAFGLNSGIALLTKRWGIGLLTLIWPFLLAFSLQYNSDSTVDLLDFCMASSMLCLLLLQLYWSRSLKQAAPKRLAISAGQPN